MFWLVIKHVDEEQIVYIQYYVVGEQWASQNVDRNSLGDVERFLSSSSSAGIFMFSHQDRAGDVHCGLKAT